MGRRGDLKLVAMRLPEDTRIKIAALATVYGTQAKTVIVAIDSLWRDAMDGATDSKEAPQ